MGEMIKNTILLLLLVLSLGLLQAGCDLREGTIVYDVEFPRADEVDTGGSGGSGGGAPTVTLSTSATNVAENSGTITVTGTLSKIAATDALIGLVILGSGTRNTDFSIDNDTLIIAAGATTGTRTLTGIDDSIDDDGETIVIDIDNVTGGDSASESIPQQVTVTIIDDDTAAITIAQSGGTTIVTEAGSTDNFTVVLGSQPTGNVVLNITSADTGEATVSPSSLTFSSGNYTTAQKIVVTGVDDSLDDDNLTTVISVAVNTGSTTDSVYDTLATQTVSVITTDDDISLLGDFNIDNITQDFNRLSLGWDAPSNFDNSSDTYTFYWTTVAPSSRVPANRLVDASDNATPIILGTKSMYVHGTLDSTKTYYYRLGARDTSNGNILKLSTNEVSGSPLPVECTSTASSSTINDTDPDLLIYYPLNSDLLDNSAQGSRSSSDGWPFNISSNAGGSISFGEGCAYGNSAYFDGSGQLDGSRYNGSFGYNDNFSNSDIPDNWTISVWLNPDGDLEKFSSVISTGDDNDGPNLQIDVDDHYEPVGRIRAFNTISGDNKVHGPRLYIGNWYHAVLVHEADDDIFFYVNGRLRDSSTGWLKVCNSSSSPTCSPTRNQWDRIKIGLNRHGDNNWKGFIDEVKIFGRSLSATEIEALYQKTLPPIVEDLSLDNSTSGQIRLQWSAVPGSTSYTIYKVEQSLGGLTDVITFDQNNLNSSSTSLHTIPNVASGCVSGTCSHTDASLITNKWYYYRIAAVNFRGTGNVAPAAEVSARAN